MLTAALLLLVEREITRGLILGPNQAAEGILHLSSLFSSARDFLKVIDPYPGRMTVTVLEAAPSGIPIQLLTLNRLKRSDLAHFEDAAGQLIARRPEVEVRYVQSETVHDRFVLTRPFGWALGQSIKDFGTKISRLSAMSVEETQRMVTEFEALWKDARPIRTVQPV